MFSISSEVTAASARARSSREIHGLGRRLVQRHPDDDRVGEQDRHEAEQAGQQGLRAELEGMQQRRDVGAQSVPDPPAARGQRREHGPVVAGAHAARRPARLGRAADRDEVLVETRPGERRGDDVGHRHDAHVGHRAAHLGGQVAVVDRHDQAHARPQALDDEREPQRDAVVARDHDDGVDAGRQRAPDVAVGRRMEVDDVGGGVVEHPAHDVDQAALAEDEHLRLRRVVVCVDVSHAATSMRERAPRRGVVCGAAGWADCPG